VKGTGFPRGAAIGATAFTPKPANA
jgi:hypothetical protein